MSLEQELYSAILARFTSDTGAGGLADTAKGAAWLQGGMVLSSEAWDKDSLPRVEVSIIADHMEHSGSGRIAPSIVRMHVKVPRRLAFGKGSTPSAAGTMSAAIDRIETRYDQWAPTLSAWTATKMAMRAPRAGPETQETAHRIVEFSVGVCK